MKTFYISIMFHFNMLQQLHLPVNSIICKMRKYQLKLFNLFKRANNNINSIFKLKTEKTWLMFGIHFCDIQMKFRYYLKFSTNVFMVESLVSLSHQVLIIIRYSSSSLSSFKSNFCSPRNMLDKFRISAARVAKIMDSWLKDTYILCSYSRGYWIK